MRDRASYTTRWHRGALISAAVPNQPMVSRLADGALLEGVVIATYVGDSDVGPGDVAKSGRRAVLCDVLVFPTIPGFRVGYYPKVEVSQDRGDMHEGEIWVPRPTSRRFDDLTDLGRLLRANPGALDGEQVMIGFRDNNPNRPIILRGLAHALRDTGHEADPIGKRLTPRTADGRPRLMKHQGIVVGVDGNADYIVDTRDGHTTPINADGTEPDADADGSSGNVTIYVQQGATYRVITPHAGITIEPDGDITLSATAGTIYAQGNFVRLGSGAAVATAPDAEMAMLGTTWGTLHDAFIAALIPVLNALATVMTSGQISPKTPADAVALAAAMATIAAACAPGGVLASASTAYAASAVKSGFVTLT